MSNYKKLGKDVLLMTIGSFGSKLLTFVFVPFYTKMLTTEQYGTADLISTTVTLLFPFFSLIICEAMMRFALDKENDPKEIWQIGIKITLIGTLAFLVLSPIVFLTPLRDFYWYFLAFYITYCVNLALSYFARGINKVKVFALGGIVQTGVIVGTSLLFLLVLRWGLEGYLLSQIIGSAVATLYMFFAAKVYKYGFSLKATDKNMQKKMLKYSIPLIPNSASWWLADASSKFFLAAFIGTSATGIFSVANKIPHIMTTMTTIFGRAWKITAVDDFGTEKSKRFFEDCFSKLTSLMLMIVSMMLLFNKPMAHILFANDFYEAWTVVPILLFSTMMHAYAEFMGSIYTSSYKTKFLVISTGLGAAVNIILNFVLVPIMGILGSAFSVAVAQSIIYVSRLIHSRSILKMKINWKRDVLCYIVLAAQIFIAANSFKYEYVYSAIAVLLLFVFLYKEIISIAKMVVHGIFKK